MAPSIDPATWVHESSIIKEDELQEMAEFLGKGFRIHHPDAVGRTSLTHNPNPQKYMVMHYHSVGNGLRLPLHGLVRDICQTFGFPPGQLTANAHKYVASYILRCCAKDRTPTLDEFLALFSIGGVFPFYSVFPHPKFLVFDKDSGLYKKADFYYPLGPDPIPFEWVSTPGRSKASPTVGSPSVGDPSGDQAQDGATALVICTPSAALDAVPISAIPGLRRPMPSQKRPREGVTDDDFLPKKSKGDGTPASPSPLTTPSGAQTAATAIASGELELPNPDSLDHEADKSPDQAPLQRPAGRPQPVVENASPSIIAASQGMEKEVNLEKMRGLVQDPIIPQARPDLLALDVLHSMEQAQQSLLTLTEYLGGAWGNYRAMVVLKDKELAARALQQKVGSLEQQVQALQEENARLKADASTELLAERSRVKSLQEQIATYQGSTQGLETQFDKLRGQISCLESKVSALEGKEGSLKAELVERESQISELDKSLHEAKLEGAHFSEVMLKHMGLKWEALQKLEKERKIANELRLKVEELEKTVASHQGEVAALTARAEALYEEGKFDMQLCIYEAVKAYCIRLAYGSHDLPLRNEGQAQTNLGIPRWVGEIPVPFGTTVLRSPCTRFYPDSHWTQQVPHDSTLLTYDISCHYFPSDDDLPASPAQSNDMAGLSPGKFSRLYPPPRLPAPSPPSPPRLSSGRIDWDSMTLQDFALYQRMRRARLGCSFQAVEAELSRESWTASPNLPRSPSDGSPPAPPAPRLGTWEDYDMGEADDSATYPPSERRSPWRGPPPPSS
ncbi:unnamed protein product [Cuscuta campestris]|uniref:Uncharacterized protein n=1 Tax=Cuscuta campestris TaxID=132261 RepID=A0A484MQ08_9ASTE|nr:unnamed protein product [Cuscuta campestris]